MSVSYRSAGCMLLSGNISNDVTAKDLKLNKATSSHIRWQNLKVLITVNNPSAGCTVDNRTK